MTNLGTESSEGDPRPAYSFDQHFEPNITGVGYTCRTCGVTVRTAVAGRMHWQWHEELERRLDEE